VASGLVFWVWGQAYNPLSAPLELALPGLQALLGGGWLFAGVLGGLIIRKPGAALYTELLAAAVSALIGTMTFTLQSGLVQGIGTEIIFASSFTPTTGSTLHYWRELGRALPVQSMTS
jgi:energy-coupling factor transport system substrate-specific component